MRADLEEQAAKAQAATEAAVEAARVVAEAAKAAKVEAAQRLQRCTAGFFGLILDSTMALLALNILYLNIGIVGP